MTFVLFAGEVILKLWALTATMICWLSPSAVAVIVSVPPFAAVTVKVARPLPSVVSAVPLSVLPFADDTVTAALGMP